jgi:UDP-N-acetylglucosamine 4,6-dehydratase
VKIDYGWEYTSHNTTRLDVHEIKELLLKLSYIREQLAGGEAK